MGAPEIVKHKSILYSTYISVKASMEYLIYFLLQFRFLAHSRSVWLHQYVIFHHPHCVVTAVLLWYVATDILYILCAFLQYILDPQSTAYIVQSYTRSTLASWPMVNVTLFTITWFQDCKTHTQTLHQFGKKWQCTNEYVTCQCCFKHFASTDHSQFKCAIIKCHRMYYLYLIVFIKGCGRL